MNKVFILQEMGYEFGVDYSVDEDDNLIWLMISEDAPLESVIQEAWDAHIATIPATKLANARNGGLAYIDSLAEAKRLEYISSGSGQALVYEEKARQAQQFKDGGYVNSENFEFISKESTATDVTPTVLADSILANRAAWITIGSDIEMERMTAKAAVRDAIDEAAINAQLTAYVEALKSI